MMMENRDTSNNLIFISHSSSDKQYTDVLIDFLTATGIPRNQIKCSSRPGNGVSQKIVPEIREWINHSAVNIAMLSTDYYKSPYCMNEAGILWYKDTADNNVPVILIGLPDIGHSDMKGFLNDDYILRRLDSNTDIAAIYNKVLECVSSKSADYELVIDETEKLKKRYIELCDKRAKQRSSHKENRDIEISIDDEIDPYDDIWVDGYHEESDSNGNTISKGKYIKGKLVDGISYNIILQISKARDGVVDREPTDEESEDFDGYDYDAWKEKLLNEPVSPEHIKDENWKYSEFGHYRGSIVFSTSNEYIRRLGVEYFYIVDKKVRLSVEEIIPKYTNFRTLENFLAEEDPDELKYLKTGEFGYEEADHAEVEV